MWLTLRHWGLWRQCRVAQGLICSACFFKGTWPETWPPALALPCSWACAAQLLVGACYSKAWMAMQLPCPPARCLPVGSAVWWAGAAGKPGQRQRGHPRCRRDLLAHRGSPGELTDATDATDVPVGRRFVRVPLSAALPAREGAVSTAPPATWALLKAWVAVQALKLVYAKCGEAYLAYLVGAVLPALGWPPQAQQQLVAHIQQSEVKALKDFLKAALQQLRAAAAAGGGGGG